MWALDWFIESYHIYVFCLKGISPKLPFTWLLAGNCQGFINNFKIYFYCNLFFDNFTYVHNFLLSHFHPCQFPCLFPPHFYGLLCLLACLLLFCDLLGLTCIDLSPYNMGLTYIDLSPCNMGLTCIDLSPATWV